MSFLNPRWFALSLLGKFMMHISYETQRLAGGMNGHSSEILLGYYNYSIADVPALCVHNLTTLCNDGRVFNSVAQKYTGFKRAFLLQIHYPTTDYEYKEGKKALAVAIQRCSCCTDQTTKICHVQSGTFV